MPASTRATSHESPQAPQTADLEGMHLGTHRTHRFDFRRPRAARAQSHRASATPRTNTAATIAPVGHASMHFTHVPQPSGIRRAGASISAVVTKQPSTNQLPAPGSKMFAFFPYQPRPLRHATSRSTIALSSTKTTPLKPRVLIHFCTPRNDCRKSS